MIVIPGYQVLEQIQEGVKTAIYRGSREPEGEAVIIKILKNEYPTLEEIARLRHEYKIIQNLNIEGIVKPYSLEKYQNGLALVLEDFGGHSLPQAITFKKLEVIEFLKIAIQLAQALGELHKNQIIHKDIKPQNIFFNVKTGKVKITDFSIASRLSSENPTLSNTNFLEGTLAYISPEQTGRMNRVIDYRTDFYSLGITFYEMLTDELPFQAVDPVELVHSHIAKQPIPLHELNPEIPKAVSDIVMKLLAKTAEERYQSAYGLKADLEQCLTQLQATGKISDFAIGQQDSSSQLLIPQKLYGRDSEVAALINAFERVSLGTTEMILVSGYSGVGKSSLVQEIHKPIVRQRGYFIAGKFDQFKRNVPYASLVQAFQELMRQLLTQSSEQIAVWKAKLLAAFGTNAQVIVDVIPEVELIVGKQPVVPQLGPTEAQNRFNLVFKQFVRIFTTQEHPLVLFLDDLHWADSASLQLIQLLISDPDSQYFLLIGAYRDNEVSAAHPLMLALDEIRADNVQINTITLQALKVAHVNELIADTLGYEPERTEPLSELVLNKTQGNPFFLTQLLKSLYQDNLLIFDFHSGCWQWNMKQIQGMEISDDVVELMVSRIQKLTEPTQQVLKLAACIGNRFDLDVLAVVSEKSLATTAADLWQALQAGLILPLSDAYKIPLVLDQFNELVVAYKFLHDRVQQAAHTLIPECQRKAVHLNVGQLLLKNTKSSELEEKVFDIVNHLNMSAELITSQVEKHELAELNLMAGKKAKVANAYVSALNYITSGINFLPNNAWKKYYESTFCLYKERFECEYLCSNFEQAEEVFNVLINKIQTNWERADIYNIKMVMYANLNKYADSIKLGTQGLELFGLKLPETEGQCEVAIKTELRELQLNLKNKKIFDIICLPEMTSLDKKACMIFLMNLVIPGFNINPPLLSWVTLKMVNLSLTHGNIDISAFAYVMYGSMLGSDLEDYKSSYEFGRLALELNEKFNTLALAAKINHIFGQSINPWCRHIKTSSPFLKKAYQVGLESGDFLYAGFALGQLICDRIMKGDDLSSIYVDSEKCLSFARQNQDKTIVSTALVWRHFCLNLQGLTKGKHTLSNESFDEGQCLQELKENGSFYGLVWYYLIKLQLSFIYKNYSEAMEMAITLERSSVIPGQLSVVEYYFYYSLTVASVYFEATIEEKKIYWETLEKNQARMKKWADNCPENFLHKYLLIAAEMARLSNQELEAMRLYEQAIKSAQANEYVQNAAISNELTAKYYLERGFDTIAKTYMTEAVYGYAKWGATAKVKDLEESYPQLLSRTPARARTSTESVKTNVTRMGDARVLDLTTAIKASLAISNEIVLGKLLEKLMKIALENAGAQTGFFIAKESNQLVIEAEAAFEREHVSVLQATPIDTNCMPISIINYVERTQKCLVLDDATQEQIFADDPYIASNRPKSILCLPIIHQNKLTGILYLENNLTTAAFTPERLEILKLLTSQVSISIENASLYAHLQTYSQELEVKNSALQQSEARSREQALQLEQALHDLQQTQIQLVQTEKMSSLGQLVAGIAHELNNPITFISGNVSHANEYARDLLSLLHLYQQQYPNPTPKIQAEAEAIDVNFLIEDLPKILDSMKIGTDRIRQLVLSLRNFSRLDEAEKKPVDIHEGLDSTLLILQLRLKAHAERPAIQVIKEYSDLPLVECYAGQLNQVFMNILANAIDALEEYSSERTFAEIERHPNTVWIRTGVSDGNHVSIRIADNGPGMTKAVLKRLFDPFFTTKPVGKGTGLGLSISHQIVVEKHGGQLTCCSTPGQGSEFAIKIPL